MNLEPLIKNKQFIDTLTQAECLQIITPFARKRISDQNIKEVITLIRTRYKSLYTYDPSRITTNKTFLELFEKYKTDPSIVDTLDIEALHELCSLLKRKSAITDHIKDLRTSCQSRINYLTVIRDREALAARDVTKLRRSLGRMYDVIDDSWKRIQRVHSKEPHNVARELKAMGRIIGLMVYDLPVVQTQLYSIAALKNICKYKSIDHKTAAITDEHFWSLYTYAGPKIIEQALSYGSNWDISHLVQDVYGYNQTSKTTKEENSALAKYHEQHDLISPQLSYDAVGIGDLVYCPKPMESKVMMMWRMMHEMVDLDYIRSPHKPFTTILTVDQAIEQHPEIKDIRKYLKIK